MAKLIRDMNKYLGPWGLEIAGVDDHIWIGKIGAPETAPRYLITANRAPVPGMMLSLCEHPDDTSFISKFGTYGRVQQLNRFNGIRGLLMLVDRFPL